MVHDWMQGVAQRSMITLFEPRSYTHFCWLNGGCTKKTNKKYLQCWKKYIENILIHNAKWPKNQIFISLHSQDRTNFHSCLGKKYEDVPHQ